MIWFIHAGLSFAGEDLYHNITFFGRQIEYQGQQ
jgi:hypothetical protein